jgi:hypothetical protein
VDLYAGMELDPKAAAEAREIRKVSWVPERKSPLEAGSQAGISFAAVVVRKLIR